MITDDYGLKKHDDKTQTALINLKRTCIDILREKQGFNGVSIYDVSAGHFQVNFHHADITGGNAYILRLEYDLSDLQELIETVDETWDEFVRDHLDDTKRFLNDIRMYGSD